MGLGPKLRSSAIASWPCGIVAGSKMACQIEVGERTRFVVEFKASALSQLYFDHGFFNIAIEHFRYEPMNGLYTQTSGYFLLSSFHRDLYSQYVQTPMTWMDDHEPFNIYFTISWSTTD